MINGLKGVWGSIVQATFSYMGTELVGVAFGETPDPRKNVPRAVRQTLLRICFFYIAGVLVLGMSVPYNSKGLLQANKGKATGGMNQHAHLLPIDKRSGISLLSHHTYANRYFISGLALCCSC